MVGVLVGFRLLLVLVGGAVATGAGWQARGGETATRLTLVKRDGMTDGKGEWRCGRARLAHPLRAG